MESTLFKITLSSKHSGIFYGPMTTVYGVGIIAIILLNKYVFRKLKCNIVLKLIIEFILLSITLTLIEYLGGNILNMLFDIDMWNYSRKAFNFGKYICLELSLIWGVLGLLYIHLFKKFTDKILRRITRKETYFFLSLFAIDLVLVLTLKM